MPSDVYRISRSDLIAALAPSRDSNGPTEAAKDLVKRIKRIEFGFTRFSNYQIRVLLYAGKLNWDLLAIFTPAEVREPLWFRQPQDGRWRVGATMADGTHIALQLASTLAMGIPPPYGPIAAGAIGVFEGLFFSNSADPNRPVLDAIAKLNEDVNTLFPQQEISDAATVLKTLQSTIQEIVANYQFNATDTGVGHIDDGSKNLRAIIDDGSAKGYASCMNALLTIDLSKLDGADRVSIGAAALQTYGALTTGWIVMHKALVELQAQRLKILSEMISKRRPALDAHPAFASIADETIELRKRFETLTEVVLQYTAWGDGEERAHNAAVAGYQWPDPNPPVWEPTGPSPSIRSGFEVRADQTIADRCKAITFGETSRRLPDSSEAKTYFVTDVADGGTDPHHHAEMSDAVKENRQQVSLGGGGLLTTYDITDMGGPAHDAALSYARSAIADFIANDITPVRQALDALVSQLGQVDDIAPADPTTPPEVVRWAAVGTEPYFDADPDSDASWGVQFSRSAKLSNVVWSAWVPVPAGQVPVVSVPVDTNPDQLTKVRYLFRQTRAHRADSTAPNPSPEAPEQAIHVVTLTDDTSRVVIDCDPTVQPPLEQVAPTQILDVNGKALDPVSTPTGPMTRYAVTWVNSTGTASPVPSPWSKWVRPPVSGDRICVDALDDSLALRVVRQDCDADGHPIDTGHDVIVGGSEIRDPKTQTRTWVITT